MVVFHHARKLIYLPATLSLWTTLLVGQLREELQARGFITSELKPVIQGELTLELKGIQKVATLNPSHSLETLNLDITTGHTTKGQ